MTKNRSNWNMRWPCCETSGWAAFDRKQRGQRGEEVVPSIEPYPSILKTSSIPTETAVLNFSSQAKSFASVVSRPLEFPPGKIDYRYELSNEISGANHHDNPISAETSISCLAKQLKDRHTWAELTLIEDILIASSHDLEKASYALEAMASSDDDNDLIKHSVKNSAAKENCSTYEKRKSSNDFFSAEDKPENKISDDANGLITSGSFYLPPEPEWEENDVYLSHRKEALRMMRVASQHSQAASNAFTRGDHPTAKLLSSKARDEWAAAKNLNHKAAEEILRIRNNDDNIWKIDLHGLHASEAVVVLKDRLRRIESGFMVGLGARDSQEISAPTSDVARSNKALLRRNLLEVITGTGNHSKGGQAALPSALRSFLIENEYWFDEARPGVLAVRPKFRRW